MSDEKKVEHDPEVLAEEKQNRIWHLKLERYKEMAGAVSVILQTFKSEAISLVSGIGTLVVGWYQVKKYAFQGHAESRAVKSVELGQAQVLGKGAGKGYGSGSGRLGHTHNQQAGEAPPPPPRRGDTSDLMPPPGSELIGVAASIEKELTVFSDPMTYTPLFTAIVFAWSSKIAWDKRKKKKLAEEASKGVL